MTERQQSLDFGPESLRHGQRHTPVDAEMLQQLRELNRSFVDLLGAEGRGIRDDPDDPDDPKDLNYPSTVFHAHRDVRVSTLDAAQRSALASCPFSLFNARFQDGPFWSAASRGAAIQETAAGRESPAEIPYRGKNAAIFAGCTEMVLFYAWHLVLANPLAARIMLGMSEQTVSAFKQLTLPRLRQIASAYPGLAAPRWPQGASFWQGLLDAALQGQESRLLEMRSLGIQLIAAELGRS